MEELLVKNSHFSFDSPEVTQINVILGGQEAERKAFPFQCAIYIHTKSTKEYNFCSGSIISENFVITAAHCVNYLESGILIAGVHNLLEDEAPYDWDFNMSDVIIHKEYNTTYHWNDIALINVSSNPFNFSTNLIRKISLPPFNLSLESLIGKKGTIAGW